MGMKSAPRQKGMHNRSAARYAGRSDAATIQYSKHMESMSRGILVPVTRWDIVGHMLNNSQGVPPEMVMPEKGYQVLEARDAALPLARAIEAEARERYIEVGYSPIVFARLWCSHNRQGLEIFHSIKMPPHHEYGENVRKYFYGLEYFYVIEYARYIRISIAYTKSEADTVWERSRIKFIERRHKAPEPGPKPPPSK